MFTLAPLGGSGARRFVQSACAGGGQGGEGWGGGFTKIDHFNSPRMRVRTFALTFAHKG